MNQSNDLKIALASTFFDSLAALPSQIREKTMRFIKKFINDPKSPAINYENIHDASDSGMRSVRIDLNYRGIVYKPKKGNVHLLLWVDKHDEAYAWAKKAQCTINPKLGSIQLWFSEADNLFIHQNENIAESQVALFSHFSDRKLLKLGIPEGCLSKVRTIKDQSQLEGLTHILPKEAYEALYWLAAGDNYEEVYASLTPQASNQIDVEDFDEALNHCDTLRRFYVVENEKALDDMLHAPLEKWRVFLHPLQRKIVEKEWNGPVRVLGGAGTGKTIAAIHRAKWLAESIYQGEERKILFTTFTHNLAIDIRQNIEKICTQETMRAIEVINLDKWVVNFLESKGYQSRIYYHSLQNPYWEDAMHLCPSEIKLPENFYREEWENVIVDQGIESKNDYLKASRAGRGTPLSRKDRIAVWPVFEEYRQLLSRDNLKEREDAFRDARQLLEKKPNLLPYQSVIIDEAQDMGTEAFKLISQIIKNCESKNSLFIVGDTHQSIYGRKVTLSRCGIDIRGRGQKLKINYRTTEETRKWAVQLLQGLFFDDLDGNNDDQKGYISLLRGIKPEIKLFKNIEEELSAIIDFTKDLALSSVCLVARTNKQIERYRQLLNERGIVNQLIDHNRAEDNTKPGLRLATMHRVKGLEFDYVIMAGVNEGIIPPLSENNQSEDSVIQREKLRGERCLLYVAATRAKKQVLVTAYGTLSHLLEPSKLFGAA